MSKKSLGRSLLEILRSLGVSIDADAEQRVRKARAERPMVRTDEIVVELGVAPREVVDRALKIARKEGSTEALSDSFSSAKTAFAELRGTMRKLDRVALAIAKK